jgi:hypothetical protein
LLDPGHGFIVDGAAEPLSCKYGGPYTSDPR